MNKTVAGALVASMLIGSAPGWAQGGTGTADSTVESRKRQQFRDSVAAALDRSAEGETSRPTAGVTAKDPVAAGPQQLTVHERADLTRRGAALKTDPVARGGTGIVLAVLSIAVSVGVTVWAIHHYSKDNPTPTAAMGRR
jgi:hypothetical protein